MSATFAQWGVSSQLLDSPVSFETLVEEIAQNHVVMVGLEFFLPGGLAAGHAVLVVGWDQDADGKFLIVYDPIRGVGSDWYEDLLSAYGRGSWYCTWTGIGG